MLARLSNAPRDYAWGSTSLIAALEGRTPSGAPEAEVWFGDHPGSPAQVEDGSGLTLDAWLDARATGTGAPDRLPYLLKLLAAGSPLSIQVHPSQDEARRGAAREDAAGVPVDAPERNYKDRNHKPEVIVAVSERFEALAGLRGLSATRRLLTALGDEPGLRALRASLEGDDEPAALRRTITWLLSGDSRDTVAAVITALAAARSPEFGPEFDAARRIAAAYPGDPGVVVALLMNHVVLARGEALFVPAGVLHAYLSGLGVEAMAASDNVLRGGLTPKHIDVPELMAIVDATPGPPPFLAPRAEGDGVETFAPGIPDFVLWHVSVSSGAERRIPLTGPAIPLAVAGEVTVVGGSGVAVTLRPGQAAFATPDERELIVTGDGELFIAHPGR
ncbi:mannose-6-phosphate isomerase, class I [Microbacterium caowuchunii]|uniref:mannose-6-phosphate isomerase, class I n=1 Tax=Microbacterium caowuchunii TaxID=2614638 RepID=UPI0012474972|nr:mannose-6-phosphate isomerase, class I [Microbacterium caowuchunii]QEW00604.1 mannose-6-phosphate isomerase, class I [Microbacterium caowuchunii]